MSEGDLSKELVSQTGAVDVEVGRKRRILNPLLAIRRFGERRKEAQEETVGELARQMLGKLLEGVSEHGVVSLFHDKKTGALVTEIYTAFFTSPKIPRLQVTLWRDHTYKDNLETHERIFGVKPPKLHIQAIDESTHKAVTVLNRWRMPADDYEIVYRRNAMEEAANQPILRPASERAGFLRQILATQIDEAAIAEHVGAPYAAGMTWSTSGWEDSTETHNGYWVRDIRHQLPALGEAALRG